VINHQELIGKLGKEKNKKFFFIPFIIYMRVINAGDGTIDASGHH
jgi:hypothetical protein